MADEAKVRSVESLEFFRSALITFLTKSRKAVNHAEDAVKRGRYWVEQEQQNHWHQEGKKRARKLAQSQQELLTAKLSKFQDSVMLQEKLMRRARAELEEAELKLKAAKKWAREFDRIYDPAVKGLGKLRDFLEHDLVKGVANPVARSRMRWTPAANPNQAGPSWPTAWPARVLTLINWPPSRTSRI